MNIRAVDTPSRLIVAISNMDIEEYADCRYDYLVVSNIGTEKLCGTQPGLVLHRISNQYSLTLQFFSDREGVGKGYEVTIWVFDLKGTRFQL